MLVTIIILIILCPTAFNYFTGGPEVQKMIRGAAINVFSACIASALVYAAIYSTCIAINATR